VKHLAAYLVAMLLAAASGLFGVWQTADLWLFGLLQARDKPRLASDIALIDVPYPPQFQKTDNPESLRRELGALLQTLVRDPAAAPKEVILDFYFFKNPAGSAELMAGLDALRKARVRAYGVVNLGEPPNANYMVEHLGELYASHLTNFGHTRLSHFGGVLWYDVTLGTDHRAALPVAIQDNAMELATTLPRRLVLPLGDERETRAVTYCYSGQGLCAKDAQPLPAAGLRDKRVIVGSFAADRDNPLARPGPELLAWAVSDISAQGTSRGVAPLVHAGALAGVALLLAALTAAVYFLGYRLLRRASTPAALPARLHGVTLAALAAGLLAWALLWGVFYAQRLMLPAVLAWFSVLCAAFVCWRRAREAAAAALYQAQADDAATAVQYDVFISYAHQPAQNTAWVKQQVHAPLAAARHADGTPFKVFFDEGSIRGGRDWKREIDLAIAGSRVFLPVYSARYFDSPQCRDELAFAEQRRSSGLLVVLPVTRIPMNDVPAIYQKVQAMGEARVAEVIAEAVQRVRDQHESAAGKYPRGSDIAAGFS
jgi:hypothetical protein